MKNVYSKIGDLRVQFIASSEHMTRLLTFTGFIFILHAISYDSITGPHFQRLWCFFFYVFSIPTVGSEINGDGADAGQKTSPGGPKLHLFNKPLTDDDFEHLPAENIDWEVFGTENCERLRQWTKQKEKELTNQATQQQQSTSVCPVGRDRHYRRYWVFQSVPGLFIEENKDFLPQLTGVHSVPSESGSCNSEDDVSEANVDAATDESSVHSRATWSFVETADIIDQFLASLNTRGFREGPLRNVLVEQSDRLRTWVSQCNVNALKTPWASGVDDTGRRGRAEENLQCILREMILDFEERIYTGSLGALKVCYVNCCVVPIEFYI
jgi:hypothetical protein